MIFPDRLRLRLLPFGFAEIDDDEGGDGNIRCHHGTAECYANSLTTCAIRRAGAAAGAGAVPAEELYMPVVYCLSRTRLAEAEGCAEAADPWADVGNLKRCAAVRNNRACGASLPPSKKPLIKH